MRSALMRSLFGKYRNFAMMMPVVAVVASMAIPATQLLPGAASFEGTCRISIGKSGSQRYAALKCQSAKRPGVNIITGTYWEKTSKKEFDEMSKLAGKRLICHFQKSGTSYHEDTVVEMYSITDCK